MTWVSFDVVDGSVMLALLEAEFEVDFDLLSLVGLENVTLLGTNQVLEGRSIGIVLEGSSTEHLGSGLTVNLEGLDKLELFSWTSLEVSLIPPKEATIGGG